MSLSLIGQSATDSNHNSFLPLAERAGTFMFNSFPDYSTTVHLFRFGEYNTNIITMNLGHINHWCYLNLSNIQIEITCKIGYLVVNGEYNI